MQKSKILSLIALTILSIFLVSTVSAYSVWEPKYESYRLGSSTHSTGAYSSTSTYEKTTVENEDRFGSDKTTVVKKTESESYVPVRNTEYRYSYDYSSGRYGDRYDVGYRYSDNSGFGRTYVNNQDTYFYVDGKAYPSTNWRFKEVYHNYDYPNENDYGYDYYYSPRYDWHQDIYNWRY
ncbi:MAG TPA: hypothetical protein VHA12_00960 [Candidatus Nanoarchaeia archaeon]|nr:hypothetical protein [Candidatus Nanoarchaeia archaeon]